MEDNTHFFSAFNTSEPVFARKSAAPPPREDETPMMADENSAAAANGANAMGTDPNPMQQGAGISKEGEEPMDQDAQTEPIIAPAEGEDLGSGKRARNRSRAKRADRRLDSKSPDVNKLLESLEDPNLPPLPSNPSGNSPPLPAPPPPPPPPPPPGFQPSVGVGDPLSGKDKEGVAKSATKTTRRSSKEKKGDASTPGRIQGSSQRTLGFGHKQSGPSSSPASGADNSSSIIGGSSVSSNISDDGSGTDTTSGFQSYNRQWKAGSAASGATTAASTSSSSPSSSSTDRSKPHGDALPSPSTSGQRGGMITSYGARPRGKDAICTDITSFRFTPDDDLKVDIVRRRLRGDPIEKATYNNEKHVLHQLPAVSSHDVTGIPLAEAPGATSIEDTKDRFISVADFASQERGDPTVFHTITKRDAIVFLIVSRPAGARGKIAWDLPALSQCQDFSNDFISKIYENGSAWARAYVRSGKWGKLGTILLSTSDLDELAEFRRQFALFSYRNESFDMFPKDALTAKADVSILLRASMKTFKTEIIPTVLFARNKDNIAGSLRVMSSTFYSAEELSHKGEPKQFWRSIDLKGDDQFMRCLRFIPESHSFLLGYDSVQIRGGLRPQESNFAITGSKRTWADIPPPNVPLLQDPRHIFPSGSAPQPDENSARGAAKRGRGGRGSRRGERGSRGRRGRQ